ncbi:glycosyltransferase family 4 protein [Bacillus sp. JCM 19041]|uniref:glycosyltransferase family 4 protein n=1 Tax=Bacillus sp. JCM 19041 TaxID=1460637 RepID=UPI0006D03F96
MTKHLLVYDYEWWVLGAKAKIIQRYHPYLEICSLKEVKDATTKNGGADRINSSYEVISALGIGIALSLSLFGVRVDTSQIGSYNYVMRNHSTYREWQDLFKPNHDFFHRMIPASHYGAINPKLANEIKKRLPQKKVAFIRPFVDTDQFSPAAVARASANKRKLVIGWVGNDRRRVKNYHTLYKPIVKMFKNDPDVHFVEATRSSSVPLKAMPEFYKQLDLLLITSSNEGGPAPAMEAYASGVPVLSTNVGYVKTVSGPKGRSFILNSLVPAHFAEKINELKKDKDCLKVLKKEAREQMVSHFTMEDTIGDWLEALFHIRFRPKTEEDANELKPLCMTTYVYGNYKKFIPYYIYSILKSYPDYYVKIFANSKLSSKESGSLQLINQHLSKNFEVKETYRPNKVSQANEGKARRFLLPSNEFNDFEYVYIAILIS